MNQPPEPEKPLAWWEINRAGSILAILSLMNFINYIDRGIIAPLVPLLTAPGAEGGMSLTNTQIGLLATAFMVVHSIASVPLGLIGDYFSRKKVIAAGVAAWSVATAAAGIANNYGQLFVARAAVGIGEAAYAPAATAMISERFRPQARARAMGVFQLGMILGGATAIVLGGWVGHHWGWRAAFLVVGLPGIVLSLLALLIREAKRVRGKKRAATEPPEPRPSGSIAITVAPRCSLFAAAWVTITGIAITFFVGAMIFWGVAFVLKYQYGGSKDHLATVTTTFGLVGLIASAFGVLAGSFLADRLEKRSPGTGRLLTIIIGVAGSVPCALLALYATTPAMLYIFLGAGVFFAVWYAGPILAALHDVVPPHRRATATGAYLLAVHLLGDAISPSVVAFIADASWGSLRLGLVVNVAVLALAIPCALVAMAASRRLAKLKHPAPIT